MTGFIDSIVSRFSGAENIITPRLSGRYESALSDQQNQVGESTIMENESAPVLNVMKSTSSLKDTSSKNFDNNIYHEDQLHSNEDLNFLPLEKQGEIIVKSVNNDLKSKILAPENNSFIKTFIQPSHDKERDQESFHVEAKKRNDLRNTSYSDVDNDVINSDFLNQELDKEKQRNKVDKPWDFSTNLEQNSTIGKEYDRPDYLEHTQNNKPPVIKISIGRIEVRAIPISNSTKLKDNSTQKPKLSLEEYLQKRNKGQ